MCCVAGSVVLLFEEQIARGGPVTHPDMRRSFVSIPEAAQLVLYGSAKADCGELCVLDMGEPVRILDLVEVMMELHGLESGVDIEIEFTGIGLGEKLEEQLLSIVEAREARQVGKLLFSQSEGDVGCVGDEYLERLWEAAKQCRREEIRGLLQEMVRNTYPLALWRGCRGV
jgi:FlaA1/EpsC-like NDP-sugar epimerase